MGWTIVRFLHLLGVATWLGGMLFLGLVVIPVVRASGGIQASRGLVTKVARRFGWVGGAAWVVILATGFGLLHHRGLSPSQLPDSEYGRKIMTKLILLLLMGVVVVVHGAWQSPRLVQAETAGDAVALRRWKMIGALLDGFMLLGTLVALYTAATLIN
ncbi:MAG: DUF4149 domain-containing protein [Thermoleophilia bacterium]|mgnify:CR=1 FL=1